jgi:NADPH:quinone reductase-like Zn-dependent oxidoreductase
MDDSKTDSDVDNGVLIGAHAASVNPLDWHFMRGRPYALRMQAGLRKPKNTRLGVDVGGQRWFV